MSIPFKTYLVGGAVRDQLLGRPVTDEYKGKRREIQNETLLKLTGTPSNG